MTFIGLMRPYLRTIQNDGIHIDNLTYWHDDLVELRKLAPPNKDGKWMVRKDPYDLDRAWIQHPISGEWLECISESYRRDGYPFASGLRLLREMPASDDSVAAEWAAEQLARTADAPADNTKKKTRAKKAEKRRAVLARRKEEAEPRPSPIADPEPATVAPSSVEDDFAIVRTNDRLWND